MITDLIEMAANVGMVIGPCIGFIIQIQKMISSKSAEGFSTYISFILLISNIIRVFWWQTARFSLILLFAAILMIGCQFVLLYTSVKYSGKSKSTKGERDLQSQFQHFWQWESFGPYLKTIAIVTTFFAGMTMLFEKFDSYSMLLGTLSSGVEAMIGTPQFKLNYQRKNTKGLSIVLIAMWLFGDLYKLSFYKAQSAPVQLFACAGFQVMMDLAILSQFWIYRAENSNKEKEGKLNKWFNIIEGQKERNPSDEELNSTEALDTASAVSRGSAALYKDQSFKDDQ